MISTCVLIFLSLVASSSGSAGSPRNRTFVPSTVEAPHVGHNLRIFGVVLGTLALYTLIANKNPAGAVGSAARAVTRRERDA